MAGDVTERCPVLADDNPGFFCLNQHFAGVSIKKDVRYPGSLRDHSLDLVVGFLGVFENGRPDHDPFSQVAGKDLD